MAKGLQTRCREVETVLDSSFIPMSPYTQQLTLTTKP